ncbi:MAG TPA: YjbE family putative metal transport protein [Ktedonobacterales bacterium]
MLTFFGGLGAIILVDLALSGDNALVIGAAASGLPRRRRLMAILAGGGAAIVLRVAFSAAATLLLVLPLLEAIGGLALLVIAARLLMGRDDHNASSGTTTKGGAVKEPSFGKALLTILIADVTMSLDNILAIGGLAHGSLELLVIGLVISIALLMLGSAVVAELIGRLPWLLDVAALVLGWTAGSMIHNDHIVGPYLSGVPYANVVIPVIGVLVVLAVDIFVRRRAARKRQPTSAATPAPSEQSNESNETTGVK